MKLLLITDQHFGVRNDNKHFINHYKKFQKYYFDNILPKGGWAKIKHSAVVCQFYFYCLVKSYNIKVSTTKNYGDNDYTHYIGKRKWMYNPIDLQK